MFFANDKLSDDLDGPVLGLGVCGVVILFKPWVKR